MDCRVLQLVIQSAHGLRNVNHVTAMKPYALVSIRDNQNNLHSSEEKTPEDAEGGSNPTWNSPVTFNLDITKAKESNLELVVKLMSFRTDHWFRDKEIGEVRVFITKLLEGFGGKAKADAVVAEKQMTASVMTTDEKPQGTLVFSYKFESVTAVQKPARHNNVATAPQNVRQNREQPARLVNPLISKKVEGIAGTALNKTGLTSMVASDAAAAPPPPAIQTRVAAANQRGADDPHGDNNERVKGNALNTTGLTSASDATAAPPSPAIQTRVAAAVDQRGADDPSEDNNEGIAGTALHTTGLTSTSDADAAPPSPTIQTHVAAAVDQSGADDPSEDNNEGIAGTALHTTGLTSTSDAHAAPPSPTIQTPVAATVDQRGPDDQFDDNNDDEEEDDDDGEEDYE